MVYKLYGLTPEEIKIVEEMTVLGAWLTVGLMILATVVAFTAGSSTLTLTFPRLGHSARGFLKGLRMANSGL